MYVPRRHTRRLLLPPVWVALGFLLLLGCQVLQIDKRLRPENVLQLTMPMLEKVARGKQKAGEPYTYLFTSPLASIKTATHWQETTLVGKPANDLVKEAAIEASVLAIQADKSHARGVRIRLGGSATYRNLVSLLDIMLRLDHQRYWLDIEHRPTTFYIVNGKAIKTRKIPTTELTYY
jgi:hypothetical protein